MNFCLTSVLEDHIIRYPSVFIQLSINFPFNLYYAFILTCFRLSRDRRLKARAPRIVVSLGALIVRILLSENLFTFI